MKNVNRVRFAGIAVLLISALVGVGGTIWGIRYSFAAMKFNERAGIGAVGGGLWIALVFGAAALFGILLGIVLIVIGSSKRNKDKSN